MRFCFKIFQIFVGKQLGKKLVKYWSLWIHNIIFLFLCLKFSIIKAFKNNKSMFHPPWSSALNQEILN